MTDTVVLVPSKRQAELERYVQDLPEVLSGRREDDHGVVPAIHARVAYTLYAFIMDSFEAKGRGEADDAGETWEPLSPQYLAYVRPVTGRQPPKAGGVSPGGNDGYMTPPELKQWQRLYGSALRRLMHHYPIEEAKNIAAGYAWNVMKTKHGVKTKLGTFGERKAGVEYQTLVDTGQLRRSLQPGILKDEEYTTKDGSQIYESGDGQVTIGSRDRTAAFHHNGRGRRKRRLWPERLPDAWWREIIGQVRAGIMHFADFFGRRT